MGRFLDVPQQTQQGQVKKYKGRFLDEKSSGNSGLLSQIGKTIEAGSMEGLGGIANNIENAKNVLNKSLGIPTSQTPIGKFAQEANNYAQNSGEFKGYGIPQNKFRESIPGMITEGLTQTPHLIGQVEALGGGIPGMAAQGALTESPRGVVPAIEGGLKGAILGKSAKMIGNVRPAPESTGMTNKVTTLLARLGLGGALFGGAAALEGGTPQQSIAAAGQGALMSGNSNKYNQDEILARADKLGQQGRDTAQQILKPPTKKGLKPGETIPEVEATYQAISDSPKINSYRDLLTQLNDKASKVGQEASDIVSQNNFKVSPVEALNKLEQKINKLSAEGHHADKLKGMIEIYNEEKAKIENGEIGDNRSDVHERKQILQRSAAEEGGYAKSANQSDPRFTGRQEGLMELARGYREITEGGDKRLSELNSQYGPLLESSYLSGKRLNESINSGDIGRPWWSKFLHIPYRAGSLVHGGAAAVTGIPIEAARMAQESSQDIGKLVGKVLKSRAGEQLLNPSKKQNLSAPMNPANNPVVTPPEPQPTPPDPYVEPYSGGAGNYSGPEIINPETPIPYNLPFKGGAGNYSGAFPEAAKTKPPYGEDLPYKNFRDLARKRKNK